VELGTHRFLEHSISRTACDHSATPPPHTRKAWQTRGAAATIGRAIAIETEAMSETHDMTVATAQMLPRAATVRGAHDPIAETDEAATVTAPLLAVVAIEAGAEGAGAIGMATAAATDGMITTETHAILAPIASRHAVPEAHRQALGGTSIRGALPSLRPMHAQLPAQKPTRT
jgi:hypothetical protein